MFKKSLKDLNQQELSNILKDFGNEGTKKIFQSEAQFQFELAWKFQELYDCKAKLEDLTIVIEERDSNISKKGKLKRQKIYTDIVLEKDDYRIAIELKYKTAELDFESDNILLFDHSAVDLGRYDYLWDVNRIELLVYYDKKYKSEQLIEGKRRSCELVYRNFDRAYDKGFAILLTNEQKYWEEFWEDESVIPDYTIDNRFKIGEIDSSTHIGQLYSDKMDWKREVDGKYPKTIQGKSEKGTSRARPIKLLKRYEYKWEDYGTIPQAKNGDFKYLIISV